MRIRGASLLACLLLCGAASLYASSCAVDSLANYISLGAGGCSIGSASFTDFQLFPIPFGATPIDANNVTVNPLNIVGNAGFQFDIDSSAASEEFFDIAFGFQMTDTSIGNLKASLIGSSVTGDGSVTTIEDFCANGQFSGGPLACNGTNGTLLLIDTAFSSSTSKSSSFLPVPTLGIIKDIGIDGGLIGSASIRSVTDQFQPLAPIPEPSSIGLLFSGISALVLTRFLARKS